MILNFSIIAASVAQAVTILVPPLEVMQNMADERHAKIQDLSVTFRVTLEQTVDTGHDWVKRRDIQLNYCSDGRFQQHWTVFDRDEQGAWNLTGETNYAFDGKQSLLIDAPSKLANISQGAQEYTRTKGCEFFDLNLLNPPLEGVMAGRDQSMQGLLDTTVAHVRLAPEPIDGHECAVVDVVEPLSGRTISTLWLDVDRGLVPLKQQHFASNNEVRVEYQVQKAAEIEPGLWLAVEGTKRVSWGKPQDDLWKIIVLPTAQGPLAIQSNTNPSDEVFKPKIPEGFTVVTDTGLEYIQK